MIGEYSYFILYFYKLLLLSWLTKLPYDATAVHNLCKNMQKYVTRRHRPHDGLRYSISYKGFDPNFTLIHKLLFYFAIEDKILQKICLKETNLSIIICRSEPPFWREAYTKQWTFLNCLWIMSVMEYYFCSWWITQIRPWLSVHWLNTTIQISIHISSMMKRIVTSVKLYLNMAVIWWGKYYCSFFHYKKWESGMVYHDIGIIIEFIA